MAWRLGIDMGTNSIGWAAVELSNGKPSTLIDAGVRIFSDGRNPKDGQSLAVQRRVPKAARRRRDRYLDRRATFLDQLTTYGLMPSAADERKQIEALDPWVLRARGLEEELTPHELGRALFHLQQRRGFKSNRKTDNEDQEGGAIAEATQRTLERLEAEGARTLGELFGRQRIEAGERNAALPKGKREPQPAARVRPRQQGNSVAYDYYPTRALIRDEFERLWLAQAARHPAVLTEEAHDALFDTLFFQRPLKPQPVGKCTLDPLQERAPRALPTIQRFRIYQEANTLQYRLPGEAAAKLTVEQRDKVVAKLLNTAKVTFDSLRKTVLKLPAEARFNLESESRMHLDGDKTAAVLGSKKLWGEGWRALPLEDQTRIVRRLLEVEDEPVLLAWLKDEYGVTGALAEGVARANLPDGHAAFCEDVAVLLLAELQRDVITYDKAVERAGFISHSRLDHQGEILDHLPYYGEVLQRHVAFGTGDPRDRQEVRLGKIANPTVHVALNQLRRVVNALIDRFGAPDQIVVEVARDLPLSAKGRRDLERTHTANLKANEERRTMLRELSQPDNYANRLRIRLWEELNPADPLDRRCPFTGEQISIKRLFSAEVEIEHILPRSRTLDDSPANKTLAVRRANRDKGERSPFEAFGASPSGYDWNAITARSANMPANKAWRFAADAMDRFENDERDFMDRQLRSTQYIARLTANYLVWVVGDPAKVWVTPGRLTSDLRHHWGLNSILSGHNQEEGEAGAVRKNRNDHRHHAIDAVVTALTDRALLKKVADAAARAENHDGAGLIQGLEEPWTGFREDAQTVINQLIVSHKPEHGVQGALHNDTAYGLASEPDKAGKREVVHRVPLATLSDPSKLELVRDETLRASLQMATEGLSGAAFLGALLQAAEAMSPPVRRVRIIEKMNVITMKDRQGHVYKAYKGDGNYCYDIFANDKGKWSGEVISRFSANQPGFDPSGARTSSGEPLIMRLRVGDMVALDHDKPEQVMRVVKLSSGKIVLAGHHEAGALKARDASSDDPFKYLTVSPGRLQTMNAHVLIVDPAGRHFQRQAGNEK